MSYFYNVVRMSAVGAFMVAALSAYAESVQVGELFLSLIHISEPTRPST